MNDNITHQCPACGLRASLVPYQVTHCYCDGQPVMTIAEEPSTSAMDRLHDQWEAKYPGEQNP